MVTKYSEGCECGGTAKYLRTNKQGDVILKCNRCGDTFDAVPAGKENPMLEKYLKAIKKKRKLRSMS